MIHKTKRHVQKIFLHFLIFKIIHLLVKIQKSYKYIFYLKNDWSTLLYMDDQFIIEFNFQPWCDRFEKVWWSLFSLTSSLPTIYFIHNAYKKPIWLSQKYQFPKFLKFRNHWYLNHLFPLIFSSKLWKSFLEIFYDSFTIILFVSFFKLIYLFLIILLLNNDLLNLPKSWKH